LVVCATNGAFRPNIAADVATKKKTDAKGDFIDKLS
jgi:hypothetical protein